MVLLIKESEVREIIPLADMKKVIGIMEETFCEHGRCAFQMPAKTYLDFPEHGGDLRIMPSYINKFNMAGTKIVNVHPGNPAKDMPTVMATIMLNDPATGEPVAVMGGTHITRMRTGAAAGLATKLLSRKDSISFGIVGAGGQSSFQTLAVSSVRDISEFRVCDTNDGSVSRLIGELAGFGIVAEKSGLQQAVYSDILTTITPVREPIVKAQWLKDGMHINAMGADAEGKQELETAVLKKAKVVIDEWEQASHAGEINVPFKKGLITRNDIHATLGEIVTGKKAGRTGNEITIFDSTGLSIQDVALAHHVYNVARKTGAGQEFSIFS